MDQPYRTRKLDLILHLVANLNTTVVLKAASRPDSTDLLRHIQANALPNWTACYLKATPNLDFAGVTEELLKVLRKPTASGKDELHALLEEQLVILERQRKYLVLLLDHAGVLMPGMLAAICQYARLNPPLKIVCSLKPDEVAAKTTTDALAMVDAQILPIGQDHAAAPLEAEDLPAVALPPVAVPKPPKIVKDTPPAKPINWRRIGGLAALLLAVAAAATWRIWMPAQTLQQVAAPLQEAPSTPVTAANEPAPPSTATDASPTPEPAKEEHKVEPPVPANLEAKPAAVSVPEPKPTPALSAAPPPAESQPPTVGLPPAPAALPIQAVPEPKPMEPAALAPAPAENPKVGTLSPASPPVGITPPVPASQPPATTEPAKAAEPPPAVKQKPNAMGDVKGADWLLQQSGKAFTLQLVTVSQLGNVPGLIRRLPPNDDLSMYKTNRGAGEHYYILYGLYPSLAAASAAATELAGANGGRPVPRPLKAIQDDIRKSQSQPAPQQPSTDPLTQP